MPFAANERYSACAALFTADKIKHEGDGVKTTRWHAGALFTAALLAGTTSAWAQGSAETPDATVKEAQSSMNLAEGFRGLPRGARVVLMPVDMELFSISAGGVREPRADWTDAASGFFRKALLIKKEKLDIRTVELNEDDADEMGEINRLHAAVASAIALHHFNSALNLPTKAGKLDWSLGEAVQAIKGKTGADYALFNWVRDSYASDERKAAMVVMALFGVGLAGGFQVGYSSLVDLNTGRVLWFNRLIRGSGDLREAKSAEETLDALMENFPTAR